MFNPLLGTAKQQLSSSTASQESSISSEDINDLVVLEPADEDVVTAVVPAAAPSQEVVETSAAVEETSTQNTDDANAINKYCKCSFYECNCCRPFRMPIALLGSQGCAKIRYLEGDKMSVGLSFGDRLVASRVISSRKPTPIW